jgi:hypothetical protein
MTSFRSEWQISRENGRECFESSDYTGALDAFQDALQQGRGGSSSTLLQSVRRMSIQDEQYLLSNIIACRLKIGGIIQAKAAIQDAQACISLNPQWSKAHVRLASSYLYLGECEAATATATTSTTNRYSNDACNALQTALRYDPQNRTSRQMLIQQLQSRENRATTTTTATTNNNNNHDTSARASTERDPPTNPNYVPPDVTSRRSTAASDYDSVHLEEVNDNDSTRYDSNRRNDSTNRNRISRLWEQLVDVMTLTFIRVRDFVLHMQVWYMSLSNDTRNAIHIGLFLLLLYIGFGGRFGIESSP